jgi:beta-lactamase regulating signal transducer with metallopeptidase domain
MTRHRREINMLLDLYLQFAGALAGFFLKVAVAYFLCLLLTRLLGGPGQRFAVWLVFMLGSLAYWLYLGTFFIPSYRNSATISPAAEYQAPFPVHQFVLPAGFQHPAMIVGGILAGLYATGVLLLLALAIWKRIGLRSLLRQADEPSSELAKLFREMSRNFGVQRCELLIISSISSPATVYWWRPRILLPPICEQLGAGAQMEDILGHELAHVARRDYFWSDFNDLIRGLLFFHPAVWLARKQMRIQREMACDLAVVAARPEHRADYAYTLTRVARLCLPRKYPIIGIDFAASASLLSDRINAILNQPQQASWLGRISRFAASLVLVGAYGFLCTTFAVVVAFAHVGRSPQAVLQVRSAPGIAHSGRQQRTRAQRIKTKSISRPAESLITESPAYRLQASPDTSVYAPAASVASNVDAPGDAAPADRPNWKEPRPASRSTARTLGSIIAATVGAIAGQGSGSGPDKDDRGSKRRDGHFQASPVAPTRY